MTHKTNLYLNRPEDKKMTTMKNGNRMQVHLSFDPWRWEFRLCFVWTVLVFVLLCYSGTKKCVKNVIHFFIQNEKNNTDE